MTRIRRRYNTQGYFALRPTGGGCSKLSLPQGTPHENQAAGLASGPRAGAVRKHKHCCLACPVAWDQTSVYVFTRWSSRGRARWKSQDKT
jgi:hypothetical protein